METDFLQEDKGKQKTTSQDKVSEESNYQATKSKREIKRRRDAKGKYREDSDATLSDDEANDLLEREAAEHNDAQHDLGHYERDLENDQWHGLAEAARLSRQRAETVDTETAGPSHAGKQATN